MNHGYRHHYLRILVLVDSDLVGESKMGFTCFSVESEVPRLFLPLFTYNGHPVRGTGECNEKNKHLTVEATFPVFGFNLIEFVSSLPL